MVRFSSKRERRLWAGALVVLVAIYASAVWGGALVELLRRESLLGVAFAAAFLVVTASVIGIAVHTRAGAAEVWVGIGVVAVCVMIIVRLGVSATERTHLFEYGLLAVLVHEALVERRRNRERVPVPAVLAVVLAACTGWIDEAVQAALPDRVYDIRDVGVNALAASVAVVASKVLRWVRRRTL